MALKEKNEKAGGRIQSVNISNPAVQIQRR
jgi:hypothetical protein